MPMLSIRPPEPGSTPLQPQLIPPTCTRPISGRAMAPARSCESKLPPACPSMSRFSSSPDPSDNPAAPALSTGAKVLTSAAKKPRPKPRPDPAAQSPAPPRRPPRRSPLPPEDHETGIKGINHLPICAKDRRWAGVSSCPSCPGRARRTSARPRLRPNRCRTVSQGPLLRRRHALELVNNPGRNRIQRRLGDIPQKKTATSPTTRRWEKAPRPCIESNHNE